LGPFCNFHSYPNIIRRIKARGTRREGRVTETEETRSSYYIFVSRLEGKRETAVPRSESEDNGQLKQSYKKEAVKIWTGFIWLR
jgi:hypothetical protein